MKNRPQHTMLTRIRLAFLLLIGWSLCLCSCETPIKIVQTGVKKLWPDLSKEPETKIIADAQAAWIRNDQKEYNRLVAALIDKANGNLHSMPGVKIDWQCHQCYAENYFDKLVPVSLLTVKGFPKLHQTEGWGAALVGEKQTKLSDPKEKYYPPEGVFRSLTALLVFEANGTPRLRIYEPFHTPQVVIGKRKITLAADSTAPYGMLMSKAHHQLEWTSYLGFLWMKEFKERPGIYLMEPYQPEKTPILMVHGLLSSPLAWREMTNDIWGDPELRKKYQVWHYFYPTNYPYFYSSIQLRKRLEELRVALKAPSDPSAPINNMVILAHSMGGLVTRPLITDPGMKLWNTAYKVPPSELNGFDEDINYIKDHFVFESKPYVKKAIFMACPFRGSIETETWFGKLGRKIVDLPKVVSEPFGRVALANPGKLQPVQAARAFDTRFGSISALRPNNPVRNKMAEMTPNSRVEVHVILGDADGNPSNGIFDRFVYGDSAKVPGAKSEKVVTCGHTVFRCDEAIDYVQDLLKRWARQRK